MLPALWMRTETLQVNVPNRWMDDNIPLGCYWPQIADTAGAWMNSIVGAPILQLCKETRLL